jgi:hypothetical protein
MDLFYSNPEQIQLMKDIGVTEVYYGLETWHDRTAKVINKGGKLKNKIEGMKRAREIWGKDVYVTVGLVAGLPHDTIESIQEACDWFKDEGHKYVDWFNVCSLTIYPPTDNLQFKFFSDIEKNLDKYGYNFPDIENNPMEWTRNDDGNITSKSVADGLMDKWMGELGGYQTPRKQYWFQSALSVLDKRLDFENLLVADNQELAEVLGPFKATEMFKRYTDEYYWPKLFSLLNIDSAAE